MIDWSSTGWWDLPGPSSFLGRAAATITGAPSGVVGLSLPEPRPSGLLDALAARIEAETASVVIRVDAASGLRGRSPTTLLAAAAGVRMTGIRSATEFLDSTDLSGVAFLVDGIPVDEWYPWAYFLRHLRAERARRARMLAPSIAVALPLGVPPDDARAVVERNVLWSGRVTRLDTQLYVERLLAWPDDSLLSRAAVSVAVEMAGWDHSMAHTLANLGLEQLLDPRPVLDALPDILGGRRPSWGNGMVDRWDGVAWVHTAALACTKHREALAARLWRGQVRAVFPFLDQVRAAFIVKYEGRLRAILPLEKKFHTMIKVYTDPWELEFFDIIETLKADLPKREATLLTDCLILRRGMAHCDPAEGWRIKRASDIWEDIGSTFPDGCAGWEWPRCGQKLVLMVGPSGAGKSTLARQRYDAADIVSADTIREKLFGSLDMAGDQTPVFERVRAEIVARLSSGRTAVVDATNLRRADRLANALLAPPDIKVEYVVVDRSMAEKATSAGWRSSRPGLLEGHSHLFEQELPEILNGDGLDNVLVFDERRRNTTVAIEALP